MNNRFDESSLKLWNPYVGGFILGLVLFAAFYISGSGLGGSGGVARVTAFLQDLVNPLHSDQNAYLVPLVGGDTNPLNHRMIWMLIGVMAGGFISGLLAGRNQVTTHKGPRLKNWQRWCFALLGGILMGYGARLARGCTSGQALSGGAVLSLGSFAFMMMVFAGAYMLAYPLRKLWN